MKLSKETIDLSYSTKNLYGFLTKKIDYDEILSYVENFEDIITDHTKFIKILLNDNFLIGGTIFFENDKISCYELQIFSDSIIDKKFVYAKNFKTGKYVPIVELQSLKRINMTDFKIVDEKEKIYLFNKKKNKKLENFKDIIKYLNL